MAEERASQSMQIELRYIRRDLDEIKEKLDGSYVTKQEFAPVRNLVYGVVALMLTSVVGALLLLIIGQ